MTTNHLTETDLARWLDAVREIRHDDPTNLSHWIEGPFRQFFPFEKALLVHGELTAGQIRITHWLNSGHQPTYIAQIEKSFELTERGALRWWLENRLPLGIDPLAPPSFATEHEVDELKTFGLGRIAAHGILNINANSGTSFTFAGIPVPLSAWHRDALMLAAPQLNSLFIAHASMLGTSALPPLGLLTQRQRQIVRQLAGGLADKVIAKRLGVSEKTVRNQLSAVYERTGLANRAELIARLR